MTPTHPDDRRGTAPAHPDGRIDIVVADDHRLFREGLTAILSTDASLRVVGQADTGPGAVDAVTLLHPALVLLDVEMPGPNVRRTIRSIRGQAPGTRIIVLTMHKDAALRRDLLVEGASGYLTKNTAAADLLAAIRAYAHGRIDHRPGQAPDPESHTGDRAGAALTTRETTVLSLMAHGRSNGQIAQALGITVGTTRRHVHAIYRKLHATSRIDAVVLARRRRLLADD